MNDKLATIATFLRIVEAGSFSTAIRQLEMKQFVAGRQIVTLEQELDVVLLHCATQAMMFTEQGEHCWCGMQRALNVMREAERRPNPAGPQFQGRVHVQLSSGLGSPLLPHLLALQKQCLELYLVLSLDGRIADLITEGVNVALRFGHEPPPSHAARALTRIETTLFAVSDHYAVQSVDDPAACPHARFSGLPPDVPLRIISADETRDMQAKIVFRVNTNDAPLRALESGIGIGGIQRPLTAWALGAGRLMPILAD